MPQEAFFKMSEFVFLYSSGCIVLCNTSDALITIVYFPDSIMTDSLFRLVRAQCAIWGCPSAKAMAGPGSLNLTASALKAEDAVFASFCELRKPSVFQQQARDVY